MDKYTELLQKNKDRNNIIFVSVMNGETLEREGKRHDITRERVRQIVHKVIRNAVIIAGMKGHPIDKPKSLNDARKNKELYLRILGLMPKKENQKFYYHQDKIGSSHG
jgi:hypothetical protein